MTGTTAPVSALAAGGASPTRALRLPPGTRPDEHPVLVYLASLGAETSRAAMRSNLHAAAGLLSGGRHDAFSYPWATLTYGQAVALKAALARTRRRRSVNAALAGVRRVMREAWLLGLVEAERYERIRRVKDLSGSEVPTGRALARAELAAVFAACRADRGPAGVRDLALLALTVGCGLRAAEACRLDLEHYDRTALTVKIVGAKGRKERLLPVPASCAPPVGAWLALRGEAPGALFLALRPWSRAGGPKAPAPGTRLEGQVVRDVVERRLAEAGIAPFRPHDLRRTYISDLFDLGVDTVTVQKLAGHADPATTSLYDRRTFETRRAAVARLDLPL